jgi:hypothetical protein
MQAQHPRELAAFERRAAKMTTPDADDVDDIPADGDGETPAGMHV